MNKSFCKLALLGLAINPNGVVKPCCRFHYNFKGLKNINDFTLDEIYNDKIYKKIRKDMLDGVLIKDGCNACYNEEKFNINSLRMNSNYILKSYEFIEDDIQYLEVGFSNICNFKCRTCSKLLSTSWYNDELKLKKINIDDKFNRSFKNKKQYNINLKKINLSNFPKLTHLKLLGGELLYDPNFEKLLNTIPKNNLKNIHLEFYSNCSIFPNNSILNILKQFKYVEIYLSIDSIGKRNEYVRKNSNWNKTNENASKWISIQNSKINIILTTTVSAYNVFYLNEVIDWWYEKNNRKNSHVLIVVREPNYLSPLIFSKNILNKCFLKLQKYYKYKTCNIKKINNLLENHKSINLEKLFLEYTYELDKIRNESFDKTFPELKDMLDGN